MKRVFLSMPLVFAATASVLYGATLPENLNRVSFGPRAAFNIKAEFSNNPAPFTPNPATNAGPATGGVDHTYDDGYVLVDGSSPADGLTWNWGYTDADQVVGDTMEFHASQANAAYTPSSSTVEDDPQYGGELTYQRLMGTVGQAGLWGWEAAFSFTDLDFDQRSNGAGATTTITDSFALNGVVPPSVYPLSPYNGTFAGPGPLLGDTPTRTITSGTMSSEESLSGESFAFRFGPFLEWDVGERASVSLSAGLTLAPTSMDYKFTETTQDALGDTSTTSGNASTTKLLYGGYVSSRVDFDIDESWALFVGAQFQSMNSMELSAGTREARLDQGTTLYATAGLSFRF